MRTEVDARPLPERPRARQARRSSRSIRWGRLAIAFGVLFLLVALVLGLAFAGSGDRFAAGVHVAGVDVSGLTHEEARTILARRAAEVAGVPVSFTAGGRSWQLTADHLDVQADWDATLDQAESAGAWPLPVRGLKRLWVRFSGADVDPVAEAWPAGLEYEIGRIASAVDRPPRNAALTVNSLRPKILPGQAGAELDRAAADETIVGALAGYERASVALPVVNAPPDVSAADLEPALARLRTVVSAPVRFGWGDTHWTVPPRELVRLLSLPADGRVGLAVGGPYATTYFARLQTAVGRPPRDARFHVNDDRSVTVRPARSGDVLDVPKTAASLLAAATSIRHRTAEIALAKRGAAFTTEEAKALGVTRELSRYTTAYAGDANRIQNLVRAVQLIDGTRVAPGKEFSFNATVGRRTEDRGFRPAPVIVGGEYDVAIGGGVSQVATTVFNTAWEAGVKITDRTAHALYISRYPAGRDATVNYPDIDLRFENDTGHWLVLRGHATDAGISISLLGTPTGRRVVSVSGELREVGRPEVDRKPDHSLLVGERIVEFAGEPARAITVHRVVYQRGEVLYDENWYTVYQSEPKLVRYGTIPVEPEPPPTQPQTTTGATTPPSDTTPTETAPTTTGGTTTTTTGGSGN